MYEELYAPLPDAAAYLNRIGLAKETPEPTAQWLDRLVHAQLTHIPFDAMDVWGRGDTPSLAIDDLFDKIILRRRGGYCFELNSLFCAFLKALGYDAYLVTIHLLREDFVPPPAHCAVVCVICLDVVISVILVCCVAVVSAGVMLGIGSRTLRKCSPLNARMPHPQTEVPITAACRMVRFLARCCAKYSSRRRNTVSAISLVVFILKSHPFQFCPQGFLCPV